MKTFLLILSIIICASAEVVFAQHSVRLPADIERDIHRIDHLLLTSDDVMADFIQRVASLKNEIIRSHQRLEKAGNQTEKLLAGEKLELAQADMMLLQYRFYSRMDELAGEVMSRADRLKRDTRLRRRVQAVHHKSAELVYLRTSGLGDSNINLNLIRMYGKLHDDEMHLILREIYRVTELANEWFIEIGMIRSLVGAIIDQGMNTIGQTGDMFRQIIALAEQYRIRAAYSLSHLKKEAGSRKAQAHQRLQIYQRRGY